MNLDLYLLAGLGGFVASASSLPLWRAWCRRIGLVDDPGHRKIHHTPVPLAGGLAVLTGLCAPLLAAMLVLWMNGPTRSVLSTLSIPFLEERAAMGLSGLELLQYGLRQRGGQVVILLLGALGMGLIGLLDDRHELRPAYKFAGQLAVAFLTALAGIRVTLFVDNVVFSYLVTVLWVLTVVNAVNFMDNMNGLCAGLGVIAAWCIGLSALAQVHYLVAAFAFLTCGALLGFLPYNFPRATAFLGDTGSHVTGYVLAVLAILPHFHSSQNPRPWAVLSPLLLLAVPLLDLVRVVILRWRAGRPFYVGDTNHLSHLLVRRGLSPAHAVVLIWLLAALLAGVVVWW